MCSVQLILNEQEVKIKTTMWMRQNADYLKEMKGSCQDHNHIGVFLSLVHGSNH